MEEASKARKEKVCQEQDCAEGWSGLSQELRDQCAVFSYCPFCANELVVRCSACGEALQGSEFNYCPWCGVEFEN